MDGLRRKIRLVLGVACLILGWRVYSLAVRYGGPTMPAPVEAESPDFVPIPGGEPSDAQPSEKPAVATGLEIDESLLAARREVAAEPWGRDPFATAPYVTDAPSESGDGADLGNGAPSPPSLVFSAVCGSGDKWSAVVRGGIVRVGDVIDNQFRVTRITKGSLTLSKGGWTFHYELGTNNVVVQQGGEDR
jgi:hypothetical protein